MISPGRTVLSLAATALTAFVAPAAQAETLEEVIAYVYENDAGLLAQRAAVRATDETFVQARAAFGPQVSLNYSFARHEIERTNGSTAHAYNPSEGAVLSQPLYSGGRLNARVQQSRGQVLAARQNLRRFETDLLQRVISAYVSVRRDAELVRISSDAVKVLAQQLGDTLAKAKVRQVTATDVAQARARLAAARTQLTFAQGQLQISRAQYLGTVGKPPGELAEEPPLPEPPGDPDKAFDVAEANSPALLLAMFNEETSRARIAEARAGRRPSVNLRVEAQRAPNLPYARSGDQESLTTSLSITQPLFTSGISSSQIRQAVEENNRDRLNTEATRKLVIQGVAEDWEALSTARRALVTQEEEVLAHQTAFFGVREEERFALRSTIDILNAEAELRSAQLELVRARANEYVRHAQLLASMGVLSAELLNPRIEPYDPSDNLDKTRIDLLLPWTHAARALDAVGGPVVGRRPPAVTEDRRPDDATELPPPPSAKAAVRIVPTSQLIEEAARLRRNQRDQASSPRR